MNLTSQRNSRNCWKFKLKWDHLGNDLRENSDQNVTYKFTLLVDVKSLSFVMMLLVPDTCTFLRDRNRWRWNLRVKTGTRSIFVFARSSTIRSGRRGQRSRRWRQRVLLRERWGDWGKGGFGESEASPRCHGAIWEEDGGRARVRVRGWGRGCLMLAAFSVTSLMESRGEVWLGCGEKSKGVK